MGEREPEEMRPVDPALDRGRLVLVARVGGVRPCRVRRESQCGRGVADDVPIRDLHLLERVLIEPPLRPGIPRPRQLMLIEDPEPHVDHLRQA
jgi:hypothetical protein